MSGLSKNGNFGFSITLYLVLLPAMRKRQFFVERAGRHLFERSRQARLLQYIAEAAPVGANAALTVGVNIPLVGRTHRRGTGPSSSPCPGSRRRCRRRRASVRRVWRRRRRGRGRRQRSTVAPRCRGTAAGGRGPCHLVGRGLGTTPCVGVGGAAPAGRRGRRCGRPRVEITARRARSARATLPHSTWSRPHGVRTCGQPFSHGPKRGGGAGAAELSY